MILQYSLYISDSLKLSVDMKAIPLEFWCRTVHLNRPRNIIYCVLYIQKLAQCITKESSVTPR